MPTLPLFVHERLSTKAILETLSGHARDRQLEMQLFADPQLPLHQQLEAYEHRGGWVNRLILGDSLVVMNSLHEVKGGRDEKADVKAQAAERWVAALNADGRHGEWRYKICHDMNLVPHVIDGAAGQVPT